MEGRDRKCIGGSFLEKAEAVVKQSKSTEDSWRGLGKVWKHLSVSKNRAFVVYDRCYYPLVRNYEGRLSPSFCNCSVGWIKELFKTALEKPVKVEKMGTMKQGNKQWRFKITTT